MPIRWLEIERYKPYRKRCHLELRPLTILVGRNNAGKSALARAIPLLGGAFAHSSPTVPLPLESYGIVHGTTFDDLISDRAAHGNLRVGAGFGDGVDDELTIEATIQSVVPSPGHDARQVVQDWLLSDGENSMTLHRQSLDLDDKRYEMNDGQKASVLKIEHWSGLVPAMMHAPTWLEVAEETLFSWADGIRYLKSPRKLMSSPFRPGDPDLTQLSVDGSTAPMILAASDEIRGMANTWYQESFGVSLEINQQGEYHSLGLPNPVGGALIGLEYAGQGLAQVLPVAVMALTAQRLGEGIDIMEHPEAELHPGAHAHVAELLLSCLGPMQMKRPLVVETHSEMLLLRARRWVAEGRLLPENVSLNWIDTDDEGNATLRRIGIDPTGALDGWPEDVFLDQYDEILAIRRAAMPPHETT